MTAGWPDLDDLGYIYLTDISEPRDNVLQVCIEQASPGDFDEDIDALGIGVQQTSSASAGASESAGASQSVEVSKPEEVTQPRAYRLTFPSYIAYAIRNEAFAKNDPDEDFFGVLARVYTKSRFLDFVEASSILRGDPPRHYGLLCIEHVLDVVTTTVPILTEL